MRRNSLLLAPELSASIVVQGSGADTSKAFLAAMNSRDHNWRAKLNIRLLSIEAFTHMKHTNKLSIRPPSRLLYCHLQLSWGWRRPRTPPRHYQLSPEGLKPESYTWLWPLQCIRGHRCGHLVYEITGPHSHGWWRSAWMSNSMFEWTQLVSERDRRDKNTLWSFSMRYPYGTCGSPPFPFIPPTPCFTSALRNESHLVHHLIK